MSKKKILIDARCIGGEGQGMLTYIEGLYTAIYDLYASEYEFYFAGYDYEAMREKFPFINPDHFILLNTQSKLKLFFRTLPDIIKRYNIDFAHFQYVSPFVKNCRFIVTTHDVLFLDFPEEFSLSYRLKRKFLFNHSLQRSDIRLTVSNYSRDKIAAHFGIPTETMSITPNAVQPKFRAAYVKTEVQQYIRQQFGAENYLLYVSRIEKRKNHLLLLESYEALQLADKGIQLVLVGNDTLGEEAIVEKIKTLQAKYPGKVHWIKYLDEADLIRIYQAARIFIYPSKGEGFGIPPLEAAALGVHTLCADNTAMHDFSFFGKQLFDANDFDRFLNLLRDNLENPPPAKALEQLAQQVQTRYSWEEGAKVLHEQIRTF